MNKLITTHIGGMPIVLDDLRWIETGLKDALNGIVSHGTLSSTDVMIISGCEYDPNEISDNSQLTLSSGYVLFNEEIFKVNAAVVSLSPTSNKLYWDLKSSFDSAGNVTFEDTVVRDIYEIREFEVKQAASVPAGKIEVTLEKNLFDVYREKLSNRSNKQTAISSYTPGVSSDLTNPLKYLKSVDGLIKFNGIVNTGVVGDLKVGNLAAGITPSDNRYISVDILDGSGTPLRKIGDGLIEVRTDNTVWFYPKPYSPSSSTDKILIDGSYIL